MKKKIGSASKIISIILVFILVLMGFVGINFGNTDNAHTIRGPVQPYNSFRQYIYGGLGGDEGGRYGWNITFIENLNGDQYPDMVVGMPMLDSGAVIDIGAVYVFYGKANTGFDNLTFSDADVRILGEGTGNKFGYDVADAGDVNNDGINDLIVGGPGAHNGRGRAYLFHGGSSLTSDASNADRIMEGVTDLGRYGSAVSSAGDVNNDSYDDVIVGAPAADEVIITYGYKKYMTFYPDIWDDDYGTPGLIQFNNGCNNGVNDTNTWGLNGDNDGWDWTDNIATPSLYGGGDTNNDGAFVYGPYEDDGPDGDGLTWSNRTALEVNIGRNHTDDCPYGGGGGSNPGGSAAWGIEFNITQDMYDYLSINSTIKVGFSYGIVDTETIWGSGGTEEESSIRSRIWTSPSNSEYLDGMFDDYIFYHTQGWGQPGWGPVYDSFDQDITDLIDHVGAYYWDFGCYLGSGRFGDEEGLMAFFDNITMKIDNNMKTIITGAQGSGFGSSLVNLGDLNDDGFDDFSVGAPNIDGGHVAIIHGKQRFRLKESVSIASLLLVGKTPGDRFGHSIASAGDVDNDNITDIIIGAPGGDYANLYYGATLKDGPLVPNLWEKTEEQDTPVVEFDAGLDSTGNTPGIAGANDGWDTWDGVYGYESGGTPGSSTRFNDADSIDPAQIAIDDELIIGIGRQFGGSAEHDSGAYGIEFGINDDMITAIEAGGDLIVSYDWLLDERGLSSQAGEDIWIRTYLRNATDYFDLGWNLDSGGDKEVFYLADPFDTNSFFIQGCSEYIKENGAFYVDFGARVEAWSGQNWDYGIFHFDNFGLYVTPPPDHKFVGLTGSSFGMSVAGTNKLNIDQFGDIVIGAPNYDSPNGMNSGVIYGFFTGPNSDKLLLAENSEYLTFGENTGDNFGWAIEGGSDMDSDDFGEIAVSAVNYDDSANTLDDVGRLYIFSITKIPRIRLLHPLGGEILSGNVTVNATVSDPDENIDTSLGVYFYYSNNRLDWTSLGNDPTPDAKEIYELYWDTTTLPDGNKYYVKGWVQDLDLNKGENISLPVTIDNPHQPTVTIQDPEAGETVQRLIEIRALVKDSPLDLIGGGIDTNYGVHFYLSSDKIDWELIGISKKGTQGLFTEGLDTMPYQDGEYWIKVNGTDLDGFEYEEIINITIDNPSRAPAITLLSPVGKSVLSGTIAVSATAFDFDNDINSSGVTFYVASDAKPNMWIDIGNTKTPVKNSTGADIYSINWDTTTVIDQWYSLKGFVNDTEGLTNVTDISNFAVHNKENTPPYIEIISPQGGKILEMTQIVKARARDLENNIDQNGVSYYYSPDKEIWHYLGVQPNPASDDAEIYNYLWSTDKVEDGFYWLNVTVSDTTGLMSWAVSDETVIIHNSNKNPPKVSIVAPELGEYINGTYTFKAYAFDMENNIDMNGLTFSISSDGEDFTIISNVVKPKENNIYELSWDSTVYSDGKYWLKAESFDIDGLKGQAISGHFFIHNQKGNPPNVIYLGPHSGEVNGTIKIRASVFDLENNLDDDGVSFYYSTDKSTWTKIGNDPTGKLSGNETVHEILWDTKTVTDNIYWLRAYAIDKTDLDGFDLSTDYIIVHNNINNPPIITFLEPKGGLPLESRTPIKVEVIDFENDVERVSFYYSTDNENWKVIGTNVNQIENTYTTIWSTEDLTNGEYYIRVKAIDVPGNSNEITAGPFEYNLGAEVDTGKDKGGDDNLMFIILLIIIIVVVIILVVLALIKKSKKREKELIEEVAAEAKLSQSLEGEIGPGSEGEQVSPGDSYQSYIPASEAPGTLSAADEPYEVDVETVESYKAEMDMWKAEGYNVTRLEEQLAADENIFAQSFPIFSSNITRLKNLTGKLINIDPTGHEDQVSSIQAKMYEPDQALTAEREYKDLAIKLGIASPEMGAGETSDLPALEASATQQGTGVGTVPQPELPPPIDEMLPQLLPATDYSTPETTTSEPVSQTDVPPDVELPPDLDLPSEPVLEPESTPQEQAQAQVPQPAVAAPTVAQGPSVSVSASPEPEQSEQTEASTEEQKEKKEEETS